MSLRPRPVHPIRTMATAGLLLGGSLWMVLFASGCPDDPRDSQPPEVVAKVGPSSIGRKALLRQLTWAGVARTKEPEVRVRLSKSLLEQLIDEELLYSAAVKNGVEVKEDQIQRAISRSARGYPVGTFESVLHAEQMTEQTYRERVRRQLIIDAFLAARIKDRTEVTEQELKARYDQQVAGAPRPAQILVRQVLVKTEEEANHILGELKGNRLTLEDAARRFSAAPEGAEGGLLPWFSLGEMPEVFNACFGLPTGEISPVVASNYGFHIFELVGRREAGAPPFDTARADLVRDLTREKEHAAIESLLADLRRQADISVDEVVLRAIIDSLPPPPKPTGAGPDALPGTSGGAPLRGAAPGATQPAPREPAPSERAPSEPAPSEPAPK